MRMLRPSVQPSFSIPSRSAVMRACPSASSIVDINIAIRRGGHEQLVRHRKAERLGSIEIDEQLELGGLHHRQVRRLLALENAAGIDADLTPQIRIAVAVARQTASGDEFEHVIDGRHRVAQRQRGELCCAIVEERIGYDYEAADALFGERCDRARAAACAASDCAAASG
jgi:hypothetical protein